MTAAANHLQGETSPYLLAHAGDPVEWYPWGEAAFERAAAEDKPILLSIGYSACHGCHAMQAECFQDPAIARLINELFVAIKVDREERPDIDHVYMQAVETLTGRRGWPLTVFLTPAGLPFFGGGYYPRTEAVGRPGFATVLTKMADAFANQRSVVAESSERLLERARHLAYAALSDAPLGAEVLDAAFRELARHVDRTHGGYGHAPKFPQPMVWEFCLRYWRRTRRPEAEAIVRQALTGMARGGIHDQLGGGFHRYAADEAWRWPHWEKMLGENALLARLYLDAWLALGDAEYARVARETLDWAVAAMADGRGGFASSLCAHSGGEAGAFYLWTAEELREALDDGEVAAAAAMSWGLAEAPAFEDRHVLHVERTPEEVAAALGTTPERVCGLLVAARRALSAARERRIPPRRDPTVIAGANGLMLRALAEAGRFLDRRYTALARENAEFVLGSLVGPDGGVAHSVRDGASTIGGFLHDYAALADGLLALYEATFEGRWLGAARRLADTMLDRFRDERLGFFDTGPGHDELIARSRTLFDDGVPCGSSIAAEMLLRLTLLTGDERYAGEALTSIRQVAGLLAHEPARLGRFLTALDLAVGPAVQVALVAPADLEADLRPMLDVIARRYVPNKVVAAGVEGGEPQAPLLAGLGCMDGRATAYVCRSSVCDAPTTDPADLAAELDRQG